MSIKPSSWQMRHVIEPMQDHPITADHKTPYQSQFPAIKAKASAPVAAHKAAEVTPPAMRPQRRQIYPHDANLGRVHQAKVLEDIVEDLEHAPRALIDLLNGDNKGKRLARVAADPV